jgi:rRNA maturation protein Nop10
MQRSIPWLWIVLGGLLLLAPGAIGRLLLDVAEGLTFVLVVLPLLVGGAGLIAWQVLKRRLQTCEACGFTSFATEVCPACGTLFPSAPGGSSATAPAPAIDARNVTINVDAVEVPSVDRHKPPN